LPPPPEAADLVDDPSRSTCGKPRAASPPAPSTQLDTQGTVDPSSRSMNPPKYPPTEARQGVGGTVVLIISIDGQGNVLDVSVEKSSRNRNLDRAAMDAARKWRFKPAMSGGQGVPSRVRVPVDFTPQT
jgi:protein TonB